LVDLEHRLVLGSLIDRFVGSLDLEDPCLQLESLGVVPDPLVVDLEDLCRQLESLDVVLDPLAEDLEVLYPRLESSDAGLGSLMEVLEVLYRHLGSLEDHAFLEVEGLLVRLSVGEV